MVTAVGYLSTEPAPEGSAIVVKWSRPRVDEVEGVLLVRKDDGLPMAFVDDPLEDSGAVAVYRGADRESLYDIGGQKRDENDDPIFLENGKTYYYYIFSYNSNNEYSDEKSASVQPHYQYERIADFDFKHQIFVLTREILNERGYQNVNLIKSLPEDTPISTILSEIVPAVVLSRYKSKEYQGFGNDAIEQFYDAGTTSFNTLDGSYWEFTCSFKVVCSDESQRDELVALLTEIVIGLRRRFMLLGCVDLKAGGGEDADTYYSIEDATLYTTVIYVTVYIPLILGYGLSEGEYTIKPIFTEVEEGGYFGDD